MSAADRPVIIRCLGLAGYGLGDQPQPALVGAFLHAYNPEAHNGNGEAEWTQSLDAAQVFPDAIAAFRLWTTVPKARPTRPDGLPNKPLTAFSIEILHVDDASVVPLLAIEQEGEGR